MTNTNSSGGFLIGLICGGALGAALGMLFAPRSGVATRRLLGRSADGARLRAMDLYDQAVETVSDVADTGIKAFDKAATAAAAVTGAAHPRGSRAGA